MDKDVTPAMTICPVCGLWMCCDGKHGEYSCKGHYIPDVSPTRKDLMLRAESLGIQGRHRMNTSTLRARVEKEEKR